MWFILRIVHTRDFLTSGRAFESSKQLYHNVNIFVIPSPYLADKTQNEKRKWLHKKSLSITCCSQQQLVPASNIIIGMIKRKMLRLNRNTVFLVYSFNQIYHDTNTYVEVSGCLARPNSQFLQCFFDIISLAFPWTNSLGSFRSFSLVDPTLSLAIFPHPSFLRALAIWTAVI